MAEKAGGHLAHELPDEYLPAVEYGDLPYRLAVISVATVFFGLFAGALLADVVLSNLFGSGLVDVLGL